MPRNIYCFYDSSLRLLVPIEANRLTVFRQHFAIFVPIMKETRANYVVYPYDPANRPASATIFPMVSGPVTTPSASSYCQTAATLTDNTTSLFAPEVDATPAISCSSSDTSTKSRTSPVSAGSGPESISSAENGNGKDASIASNTNTESFGVADPGTVEIKTTPTSADIVQDSPVNAVALGVDMPSIENDGIALTNEPYNDEVQLEDASVQISSCQLEDVSSEEPSSNRGTVAPSPVKTLAIDLYTGPLSRQHCLDLSAWPSLGKAYLLPLPRRQIPPFEKCVGSTLTKLKIDEIMIYAPTIRSSIPRSSDENELIHCALTAVPDNATQMPDINGQMGNPSVDSETGYSGEASGKQGDTNACNDLETIVGSKKDEIEDVDPESSISLTEAENNKAEVAVPIGVVTWSEPTRIRGDENVISTKMTPTEQDDRVIASSSDSYNGHISGATSPRTAHTSSPDTSLVKLGKLASITKTDLKSSSGSSKPTKTTKLPGYLRPTAASARKSVAKVSSGKFTTEHIINKTAYKSSVDKSNTRLVGTMLSSSSGRTTIAPKKSDQISPAGALTEVAKKDNVSTHSSILPAQPKKASTTPVRPIRIPTDSVKKLRDIGLVTKNRTIYNSRPVTKSLSTSGRAIKGLESNRASLLPVRIRTSNSGMAGLKSPVDTSSKLNVPQILSRERSSTVVRRESSIPTAPGLHQYPAIPAIDPANSTRPLIPMVDAATWSRSRKHGKDAMTPRTIRLLSDHISPNFCIPLGGSSNLQLDSPPSRAPSPVPMTNGIQSRKNRVHNIQGGQIVPTDHTKKTFRVSSENNNIRITSLWTRTMTTIAAVNNGNPLTPLDTDASQFDHIAPASIHAVQDDNFDQMAMWQRIFALSSLEQQQFMNDLLREINANMATCVDQGELKQATEKDAASPPGWDWDYFEVQDPFQS
ncbi:hypothetical protein EJ08DRAFT_365375 [Tothia fuscella]|uniref:Uncharacterized protein n=1 Tax=Tothia fuscella TaxID=1048955 RepID=A0A9P4NLT0_9PEZI|nr:hypothetical protein EJ08DRAFT_365375 [Tothia fuscella]